MATDTITFTCPACSIKLTVPTSFAGVTGPCPTCRAMIQAPYLAPAPVQATSLAPLVSAVSESQGHVPVSEVPAPDPLPVAATPVYLSPPPLQIATITELITSPPSTPAALRPEPRQLPNRSNHAEPVAKQMPESNREGASSKGPAPLGRHLHTKSRVVRFLLPLLFCLAAGALVFGVLTFLNSRQKPNSPGKSLVPSSTSQILPSDTRPISPPAGAGENRIQSLPVPEPEQPLIISPPPTLPDGIETITPGMAAMEVLEKFLAAKTLAERLPYMETQTPEAELAKSCLASPLPTTSKIQIDAQETNVAEQVIDFYHSVDFITDEKPVSSQTILVRSRGTSDPKVVVDPFLDTFGGRLAAYSKSSSDKAGVFQVTVSAVASCNEEHVPNREKKLTLKLLSRDNTKEITRAYFGRQSKIGEMLEDGTFSLSYGKAKACTVMLRWNIEDNPSMPYLEALTLKTLDWNP